MVSREVTINNNVGLHARPATFFIQKANSYKSSIWVEKDDRRVNAKSLLGVLSLGIVKGASRCAPRGSRRRRGRGRGDRGACHSDRHRIFRVTLRGQPAGKDNFNTV